MDDFDLETRRKKMFNGIKNKWQEISKGYLEKIEEMKLKNEKIKWLVVLISTKT